jgi:rubrerythrin
MTYSLNEIIDIAIGIEETGYGFYMECSTGFEDPLIRDVFEFLAKEELTHKQTFQSFKNEDYGEEGVLNEEYYMYLKAIGSSKLFDSGKKVTRTVSETATPMDAIKEALVLEKESILFYTEMKELYRGEKKPTRLINAIIAEERKHDATLYDLSQKIKVISIYRPFPCTKAQNPDG